MGHNKLTAKQELYSQALANKKFDHIWEAYADVYDVKKMSQNAIYVEACRLSQNPKVALRIKEIEAKIRAKEELTMDKIIVRLSKRNEVNAKDYFEDDGTFKKISELSDDEAVFITGIKVSEVWGKGDEAGAQIGRVVDVKFESFKDIMDMLVRIRGGYIKDKVDPNNSTDELKAILKDLGIDI